MWNPRKLLDPKLPSQKEVDEYNLSHLPYRSWCPCCVAGKGKVASHFKQTRTDRLPELHCGLWFSSAEGSPLATVLVAKERITRMILSTVVPVKRASVEFPVRRIMQFLKELGLETADIILKSDQENSILDVLNTMAARRSAGSKVEALNKEDKGTTEEAPQGRSIHESSPVGSSGSNGFIERGIQSVEGQARTIKLAFESHIGEKIPSDHNIVPWIVEYVGVLLNRYSVGADGKTGYERLKRQRCVISRP